MPVKPGTKIKINPKIRVIRPDAVTDLTGREGEIESHYISEYIVKIGQYRYSVPREAFDIVKTDNLIHVGFKHCPPTGKHQRDVWDLYFEGQRRTVRSRDLLNLLTLRHEESEYLTLQPEKLEREFVDALIDTYKGQEYLAQHPEKAACIYNATSRTRPMMGSM